jgi:hypothetical protein
MIAENQLDEWVRGHQEEAQGVIVDLVYHLVAASCPKPTGRRFPLSDSIGQKGSDGELEVDLPYEPFVPEGRSFWEIGTGAKARSKATSDYSDLTNVVPESVRRKSSFIFVTPLSARRDWPNTWKPGAQSAWLEEHRKLQEWRDVRVIDGTKLIDWLHQSPSVELWLARKMGHHVDQLDTPELHWDVLKSIGAPPLLTPQVFLVNREAACARLQEMFSGNLLQLKLETRYPRQAAAFVSAYIACMDTENRMDAAGRCLLISGIDEWNTIVGGNLEAHVLVAAFDLDQTGSGTMLLQKARKAGHAVVYGGLPGGIPHPNAESIPNPKGYQLKEALEKAGYTEERARVLSQKSGGNLASLLRCLQNLSLLPEWAERTPAAELAIAQLLGAWNEASEADRAAVEGLSGNSYREWIGMMREVALRPAAPLTQREGIWKFVVRYEGWCSLGPKVFHEHLDRLLEVATKVLGERDPRLDLSPERRFSAGIYGIALSHSTMLRNGLAETLALLGSYPDALSSCSPPKAKATAMLAVRQLLRDADWVRWAGLNDVLPLLAEAAPEEFLDCVEAALSSEPCPFDGVFDQERSGITGPSYMSGLLWALETLAWDTDYLTRVVVILGELDARDPGGQAGNRPANSLTEILLPWLPQTCASIQCRRSSVQALISELPDVAWRLLLRLLPRSHTWSAQTRRPIWREVIPDDWSRGVTHREYWDQVTAYAELAISAAELDTSKLAELVERLDDLPSPAHDQLLTHLGSSAVMSMPEVDRFRLWTELADVLAKHKRFSDTLSAAWPEQLERLAAVAERLAPETPWLRHQRLFSERDSDLYEENESWQDQQRKLDERRQRAVTAIAETGGVQSVLAFATAVQSPWRVGVAFGFRGSNDADRTILPDLLDAEQKPLAQFAGGFVWGRFRSRGWQWADEIDTSRWLSGSIGQFLAYLPFTPDTWERSARLLGEDESSYWAKTSADPYQAEADFGVAVDRLLKYERPRAAISCLYSMLKAKQPLNKATIVDALLAAVASSEGVHAMDEYHVVGLIKALQDDPEMKPDDLFGVEWAYLPLLDGSREAFPRFLERQLADNPAFFCQVIRLVFRPSEEDRSSEEPTEQEKSIATNAYRLLSDWRTPPGCREDGSYDGDALTRWLEAVKTECTVTGHLEVAMTMAGHALIHTPADPDGLWIHRSAAAALNAKDANDLRDGFHSEITNSRGMHWVDPTGKPEKELAIKYRQQANDVEAAGYHRLATTMRSLSARYDQLAERVISEHAEEDD